MAKILLVDDEQIVRQALKKLLKAGGHEVETAKDGEEALSKLEKQAFDLVMTDEQMPNMGGGFLLQNARQKLKLEIPFIIVGGTITDERAVHLEEFGFFRAIPKPPDAKVLFEAIELALQQ